MEVKSHPEWRLLFDAFKDHEYGAFIPHEEIEVRIGHNRKSSPEMYYASVARWKREMLKEASRQIECQNTRGYEIVMPDQFRSSAKRQLRLGHKRIRRAGEIVVKAPLELLSEEERKRIGDAGAVIAQILHFSKATMRKVREIDKKTDKLLIDVGKALDVAD